MVLQFNLSQFPRALVRQKPGAWVYPEPGLLGRLSATPWAKTYRYEP